MVLLKKTKYLLLMMILFSCSENREKEKLIAQIEQEIKKEMNDPDSYEFVDFIINDTLMYSSYFEKERDFYNEKYEEINRDFEEYKLLANNELNLEQKAKDFEILQRIWDSARVTSIKYNEMDSLMQVNQYKPYLILTTLKFRENNEMGAKVLSEAKIGIDIINNDLEVFLK